MAPCPICESKTEASANYKGDACSLLISAYVLAGLAMMLNIRLSYSSAPYALIRFQLPENLFSVFVRRMASALELWCLPSMLLGNIIDLFQKLLFDGHEQRRFKDAPKYDVNGTNLGSRLKDKAAELRDAANKLQTKATTQSVVGNLDTKAQQLASEAQKLANNEGTQASTHADSVIDKYILLEGEYNKLGPGDKAKVSKEYYTVKQIYDRILNLTKLAKKANELKTEAGDTLNDLRDAGNTLAQSVTTLRDGSGNAKTVIDNFNDVKQKFYGLSEEEKPKVQAQWDALNGAYGHIGIHDKPWKFNWIIAPSIVSQWLNFLTYVVLLVVYIMGGDHGHLTTFYWIIAISGVVFGINMVLVYAVDFFYIPVYIAGENTFPILTSFIHYVSTLMFGNRRKWNSDFLIVKIDIWVAIIISFIAAVVWTVGYVCEGTDDIGQMKHIHAFGFSGEPDWEQLSPALMIIVGMGLVYAIYPGIAPGMIVPFYLIDKIEMVLLVATIFPPVIIAILRRHKSDLSPTNFGATGPVKWTEYPAGQFYLFLDILMVIKITLAAIFIYSLHYKESHMSRSIINQPKMSTALSITFYMCHEILLALGFSGFIGNGGGDLVLIPQYIGALFMIFLAFYSEGYIIEYKSHYPAHWHTDGMWYLCGYYQLNPDFFIMIKFNVCSDGYCDFK